MPKFEKGSQEAKDYMASIRAKRVSMSGTGGKSSKIVPTNYATETQMATEADDRIGSTEASRNPMAVAVDDAPLASSYPLSEVPTRTLIKEIQKKITEKTKKIKLIRMRIRNNSFFGGNEISTAQDLRTIEELVDEIQRDMEFELELLGRLIPSFEVQGTPYIEGTGMKKRDEKKKALSGTGASASVPARNLTQLEERIQMLKAKIARLNRDANSIGEYIRFLVMIDAKPDYYKEDEARLEEIINEILETQEELRLLTEPYPEDLDEYTETENVSSGEGLCSSCCCMMKGKGLKKKKQKN